MFPREGCRVEHTHTHRATHIASTEHISVFVITCTFVKLASTYFCRLSDNQDSYIFGGILYLLSYQSELQLSDV